MKAFLLKLGWRSAFLIAAIAVTMFWLAPGEKVDLATRFDPGQIGPDIDAYLAAGERKFGDVTPGAQKQVVWAREPGEKSELALVYIHGFSATAAELRPVPDFVAQALGANLYYGRLAGHGRGPMTLADARAEDWLADIDEALAIGSRIGQRFVVLATSTGASALALRVPDARKELAAVVLISPNFGLARPDEDMLDWPMDRVAAMMKVGAERGLGEEYRRHFTAFYPAAALVPVIAIAQTARQADYGSVKTPALVLLSQSDAIVSPTATREVMAGWGGPHQLIARDLGPGDDPFHHILAGDILSPSQTAEVAELITDWIKEVQ